MSVQLPRIASVEVLRRLRRDGWTISRQSGAHAILRHPSKLGPVSVPVHSGKTVKLGTLRSILNQAGLTVAEFDELK